MTVGVKREGRRCTGEGGGRVCGTTVPLSLLGIEKKIVRSDGVARSSSPPPRSLARHAQTVATLRPRGGQNGPRRRAVDASQGPVRIHRQEDGGRLVHRATAQWTGHGGASCTDGIQARATEADVSARQEDVVGTRRKAHDALEARRSVRDERFATPQMDDGLARAAQLRFEGDARWRRGLDLARPGVRPRGTRPHFCVTRMHRPQAAQGGGAAAAGMWNPDCCSGTAAWW